MGTYSKKWGPKHATMSRDSVRRIDRAIEKRTRQEGKKVANEERTIDPKNFPHPLVGRMVTNVRPMTEEELGAEGWEANRRHGAPNVICFDDGSKVFASRDDEGNGPGALFGKHPRLGSIRV